MTALIDILPVFTFAEQRAQCEACRHIQVVPLRPLRDEGRSALRCTADCNRSCSLARGPGKACGPEAKLFEPKDPA